MPSLQLASCRCRRSLRNCSFAWSVFASDISSRMHPCMARHLSVHAHATEIVRPCEHAAKSLTMSSQFFSAAFFRSFRMPSSSLRESAFIDMLSRSARGNVLRESAVCLRPCDDVGRRTSYARRVGHLCSLSARPPLALTVDIRPAPSPQFSLRFVQTHSREERSLGRTRVKESSNRCCPPLRD